MADRKIGAAFVEIMAKGVSSVQTAMNKVKASLSFLAKPITIPLKLATEKLIPQIQSIGNQAHLYFGIGTAAITGFLRAADPYSMNRLSGTLGAISVQIGSIFIPFIDRAATVLQTLLDVLRSLSDQQKDQIARWVGIGLAVAGGFAAFSRLLPILTGTITAVRSLGAAIAIASGGIVPLVGLLVALVAGIAGVGTVAGQASGGLSGLSGIFAALRPILDTARTLFQTFIATLADLWTQLAPVVVQAARNVSTAVLALGEGLRPAFGAVLEAVRTVGAVFLQVFASLVPVVTRLVQQLVPVVTQVAAVAARVVTALVPVATRLAVLFGRVAGVVADLAGRLAPILGVIAEVVAGVVEVLAPVAELVIEGVSRLLEFLAPVLGAIADLFSYVARTIGERFALAREVLDAFVQAARPLFDTLSDVTAVFMDILAELGAVFADTFGGLGEWIDYIRPLYENFVGTMIAGVRALAPVFRQVFEVIKELVLSVIRNMLWLATLTGQLAQGNFTGAADEADRAVAEFDRRLKQRQEQREAAEFAGGAGALVGTLGRAVVGALSGAKDEAEKQQAENERHRPAANPKVEFVGLIDAWKKAQQSLQQQNSPEAERLRLQRRQVDQGDEHTRLLSRLVEKPDAELVGGGFAE